MKPPWKGGFLRAPRPSAGVASPYLYALPIAAAGFVAGQVLMAPALRAAGPLRAMAARPASAPAGAGGAPGPAAPSPAGMALVLRVLPTTQVLFAFVLSFLAAGQPDADLTVPLIVFGTVAALTCVVQAFVVRGGFPAVAADPSRFGALLVKTVLPETLTLAAFVYAFLQLGSA